MATRRVGPVVLVVLLATFACKQKKSAGTDGGVAVPVPGGVHVPGIGTIDMSHVNSATGHAESTGSTGTWKLDSGECYSGDKDGFFGIFVRSRADKHVWVKLVKDPLKGWNVGVSNPDTCKSTANGMNCSVEYFDQKACTTLDVGLSTYTFKGRYSSGQHQFDGTVSFDCKRDKAHVSGKLTIEKCAP